MQEISRRRLMQLTGAGALSALVGGVGLAQTSSFGAGTALGSTLRQPRRVSSRDGLLETTLVVARTGHEVGGRQATTLTYNGGLPGPTLVLRPGDLVRIRLVNRLDEPTNLHVHGLHVSPRRNGDNPFVSIGPGESFLYEYRLPRSHPSGLFWYHPHHHGMVADQVFGGLYGAIIVRDRVRIPAHRQRVLVVSDITLDATGNVAAASDQDRMMGREGQLVLVNGQLQPVLRARPGERERWRVVNACSSRYLLLDLEDHPMQLLGMDSGHFRRARSRRRILLAPGNRADIAVTAGRGRRVLRALPYDRGGMGMGMMSGSPSSATTVPLATFDVGGTAVPAPAALPLRRQPRDLRQVPLTRRRRVAFTMGMSPGMGMTFGIDGKQFDHHRIDQVVRRGAVEEWTVTNDGPMDHPFHLHVWPMQVVEENGQPVREPVWRDVVNVPAGGRIRVRIAFERYTGRGVYHCHILDHEDQGMMAVLDVRKV